MKFSYNDFHWVNMNALISDKVYMEWYPKKVIPTSSHFLINQSNFKCYGPVV